MGFFPGGFRDSTYIDWERGYKWEAHQQWEKNLSSKLFKGLLGRRKFSDIASLALRIESRTNLLFSFEKMALRDAVKSAAGARSFAIALYDFLHGAASPETRFERWINAVSDLPRKQTRVLTWPIVTVFGFIAQPNKHIFLKPMVTRTAAAEYEFPFQYASRPSWSTYQSFLNFAEKVDRDLRDLRPQDLIDIQSFIWVQGSGEYEE